MTVRAIANPVETTLATPVMADIFKISRRLRSPIVHVAIAALHKIRSAELVIVAVNRDSSSTGSVAACGIKRIPSSLCILRRLPIGLFAACVSCAMPYWIGGAFRSSDVQPAACSMRGYVVESRAGRAAMRVTKKFSILSFCLILLCGFPGILSSAAAQQQEKRIALVVGNGAYAKSPLATAAHDAGLIAPTLQAAGFDVVGARDLDGDTLRRSFRDFIQKAEASGPDTVAMVYLAGYGMQLAGENYFIPVDSALSRDVDIPIEGLRISDYIRQLASLPLKASVVVLDAARQQPFVEGGQPIASGLALVEPDPHMLVAFNAAPGTIAPNEPGPYGGYAQYLAA